MNACYNRLGFCQDIPADVEDWEHKTSELSAEAGRPGFIRITVMPPSKGGLRRGVIISLPSEDAATFFNELGAAILGDQKRRRVA